VTRYYDLHAAGTIAYSGPEVLRSGAITKHGDVYSFAMLMLELWTGEPVYNGLIVHQARSSLLVLEESCSSVTASSRSVNNW
jgi:hypothetical protein